MGNVFDVAKFILNKTGTITAMKLQKLVYYCQSWSLAWDDVPLFDEEFQAWANGPVCVELFNKHRGLFIVDPSVFNDIEDYNFTQNEIETIESVLEHYGNKEPHWLSELTHKEMPWKEARKGYSPGDYCNNVISKDSMQHYYGGL